MSWLDTRSPPLEDVLELVPDPALLRRRADGVVLDANRAFAEMVGASRGEIIGRAGLELAGHHRSEGHPMSVVEGRVA